MKLPVEISILEQYLPAEILARITQEHREKRKNYMKGYRNNYRKENVKITQSCKNHKNAETPTNAATIGSAGYSAQADSVIITGGKGGIGGVSSNNNTVHNTVTEDDVKCNIYLKEKNTKKRKENNAKIPNENFLELYKNYPRKKGKEKGLEMLAKLLAKGILPDMEKLSACLEIEKEAWDNENRAEDKIPYFSTWVNSKPWSDAEERIDARLAKKRAMEAQKLARPAQPPARQQKEPSAAEYEAAQRELLEGVRKWREAGKL